MSGRAAFLLPVVSGLLLYGSFWWSPLAWIALTPMLLAAGRARQWRTLYLGSWLGGLVFFLPGVQWLRYCDASAWVPWLALATYLSLYFPAFVFLLRVLSRWLPLLLAAPVAWVTLEFVRMYALSGFGWLMLAHAVSTWIRTIQVADLGGVYLVSFVVALVNAFWAELLTVPLVTQESHRTRMSSAISWRIWVTLSIVVGGQLYGMLRMWGAEFPDGPRLILVQSSMPQNLNANNAVQTLQQVWDLSQRVINDPELKSEMIVWPETIYPYTYGVFDPTHTDTAMHQAYLDRKAFLRSEPIAADPRLGAEYKRLFQEGQDELLSLANRLGTPILVGTIRHDYTTAAARACNAAVLVAPGKGEVGVYEKIHLVPFGEYLPFEESFPYFKFLTPYEGDPDFGLDPGSDHQSIQYQNLHFAPIICFEDTVPYISRRFVEAATMEEPVDFLLNQSNDGWFLGSEEARFHLIASVFRAVENRIPMARVSNTGITCLVDGNGRVTQRFEGPGPSGAMQDTNVAGLLPVTIPLDPRNGLYTIIGDVFAWTCTLISLAGLAAAAVHVVRQTRSRLSQRMAKRAGSV